MTQEIHYHVIPFGPEEPEHVEWEGCWCEPELNYLDPETGKRVWVHRQMH